MLTCGGAEPDVPSDAQLFTFDGVDWFTEDLPQGGTRASTVGRVSTVALLLPPSDDPTVSALVELAPSIKTAVAVAPAAE